MEDRQEIVDAVMSMLHPLIRYDWNRVEKAVGIPITKKEWEYWVERNPEK